MKQTRHVLIVGAGFVGITLAAKLLKSQKLHVTILEKDEKKISLFNSGDFLVYEPGLEKLLNQNLNLSLKVTNKLTDDTFESVFICVDTLPETKKRKEYNIIISLVESLVSHININGNLFLRSTVQVGTTDRVQDHLTAIGRIDINNFFAPERTVAGAALLELDTLPQIIACTNNASLNYGVRYLELLGFKTIEASSTKSAEFTKLISNAWRSAMFSISNEIAQLAEYMELDTHEIITLANMNYPRSNIAKPGPVGGPCLIKDTQILLESFPNSIKQKSLLSKSMMINKSVEKKAFNLIRKNTRSDNCRILFLGAAFKGKPRTNDARNSFTTNLISLLERHPTSRYQISIWDPLVSEFNLLNLSKYNTNNLKIKNPAVVVIGNDADFMYSDKVVNFLKGLGANTLLLDFWGVTKKISLDNCNIYVYGIGFKNKINAKKF